MSKVKVITRGEATRLINKEDAVVVDLRQRDDFRKGHIAGAINLLPAEIKANNVGELGKTQSATHYRCRRFRHAGARACQRAE
jgi:rhodanese-related sulfurtransferase